MMLLTNHLILKIETDSRVKTSKEEGILTVTRAFRYVEINIVYAINGGYEQCTIEIPVFTPQGKLTTKQQRLQVRIPKGIKEGETIVIAKKGSPGMGAAAGDFFLEVVFNLLFSLIKCLQ